MREVSIKGELFHVDDDQGILCLHIREPFFSAGKQFNWLGASIGLGISRDALVFALKNELSKIQVTVGDKSTVYETETLTWLNFAHDHKSKMVRGSTEIYVIQWCKSYFRRK